MSEAMNYKLPPLPDTPETFQTRIKHGEDPVRQDLFTSEQMQAYALAAIQAQGVPDGLREFVQRVAKQKPEKPDYWSACGQCERNISDAEDLIASAPPAPQASVVQQEPVAWKHDCAALLTNDVELWIDACPHCGKPRTNPTQQAKPQPLLSSEIWNNDAIMEVNADAQLPYELIERFVRAIEAAHGIKE